MSAIIEGHIPQQEQAAMAGYCPQIIPLPNFHDLPRHFWLSDVLGPTSPLMLVAERSYNKALNHDAGTLLHEIRVAELALAYFKEHERNDYDCACCYLAGLCHDHGKTGVDGAILNNRGKLTPEDWAEIHHHPVCGFLFFTEFMKLWDGSQIFEREEVSLIALLAQTALRHHMTLDGRGYPAADQWREYKLAPQASTPVANVQEVLQVCEACDIWDAMQFRKTYKDTKDDEQVTQEFREMSGRKLPEEIANWVIDHIRSGKGKEIIDDLMAALKRCPPNHTYYPPIKPDARAHSYDSPQP